LFFLFVIIYFSFFLFQWLTKKRYSNRQDKGAATTKVYSVITHLHTNKVVYKRLLSNKLRFK
jgi:uncharacterized protein YpmB